jgi:hypothetical protein
MASAINDVAKTARLLTTSMLMVAVTLIATMMAATDEALFRDSAKVFSSLGVDLTLSNVYAVAPPVFLFLHINALIQLHLVAQRIAVFRQRATTESGTQAQRQQWLAQIHGIAFAQLLTEETHDSRWLLKLLTCISIIVVPIILLLGTLISFLKYQSIPITISHHIWLLIDLVVIYWFLGKNRRMMGQKVTHRRLVYALTALTLLCQSQAYHPLALPEQIDENNLYDWISRASGIGYFRRYLYLPNKNLINNAEEPHLETLLSLLKGQSGQTSEQAILNSLSVAVPERRFIGANFNNTILIGANLADANLTKAILTTANLTDADLNKANLTNADLTRVNLSMADLGEANLKDVDLRLANLTGTDFYYADLHGTNFKYATLYCANFNQTDYLDVASGIDPNYEFDEETYRAENCK